MNKDGYWPNPEKVKVIRDLPSPAGKNELRRVLGLFGYYSGFIKDYAQITVPSIELMSLKNVNAWKWGEEEQLRLGNLKQKLQEVTLNHHFEPNVPTIVDTDASGVAIGAVLFQTKNNQLYPIVFASRKLTKTERNWSTREREAFAVVWGLHKFRRFIISIYFVVRTDHSSLRWLIKAEQLKLVRWSILLSEFDFTLIYNKVSK